MAFAESSISRPQPTPVTPNKGEYDAEYRAKRKLRKQTLIELHHDVVERENQKLQAQEKTANFTIGFRARRLLRNGEVETLPQEFARILKGCEEFIDNPNRFPSLHAWCDATNNVQSRRLIAKVLACILPNTDLIGGRVGVPTEAGIRTISYDQLQEDYALRFGEFISPNSFKKAIQHLGHAGYFHSERINVCVDQKSGTVRSAAAFKQFTERFFSDLKVVRYSNICQMIIATRERQKKKGLRFFWVARRLLMEGVQQIFNASTLNDYADTTSTVFSAYQHPQQVPL
ncbi:hypothetical protein [Photobacterium indicum]|uniref:hypothetical protein n=1 Tax=Photobacterium indicum TaxID=81447 RepID=UPI003D0CCF03